MGFLSPSSSYSQQAFGPRNLIIMTTYFQFMGFLVYIFQILITQAISWLKNYSARAFTFIA
jgi:hypothetical protein